MYFSWFYTLPEYKKEIVKRGVKSGFQKKIKKHKKKFGGLKILSTFAVLFRKGIFIYIRENLEVCFPYSVGC